MATIQARIEGRVGEDASGSDIVYTTTHAQDAYNHGLRAVIMTMPQKAWKFFGKNAIDFLPIVGTPLLTDKIISVLRKNGSIYRKCVEIDADMAGVAADSASIHYASEFTPVYYVESGSFSNPMLKVLPEDGSKVARLVSLAIPTVDITTDTIVPHFPDELEELPEIYTAAWIRQREAGYLRRSSQDELEAITSSGYLNAFEGDLPVFAPPAVPSMPTLTLPTVPSSVLAYTSAGDEPEDAITMTASLPTYSGPVFTYDTTHIADALTQAQEMMDASGLGTTDVEALIDTAKHLDQARVGIQAIGVELQRAQTSIQDQSAKLQEFGSKVQEALGELNGKTAVYQAELAKEVAEARADVAAYTAKMQDNKNVLDKDTAQYQGDLSKYSNNATAVINEYGQKASAVVSEYQALVQAKGTEFQSKLSRAMGRLQEAQVRLQTMQSFDQKSLAALNEAKMLQAEFDKKLGEYKDQFQKEPKVVFADRRRA
ncbi:hypothetical protein LCGC14_1853730 [marine sediment metagenome]|uniref:Uncharacterized protein n=1 Tax=marine sediment metagenome TaxID=412755 RepID=A0A0F9J8S7_9ZZZZ